MGTHHGSEGVVHVGANAVAEINDWSYEESAEFAEDHNLNDLNKTRHATAIKDWSAELNCWWDETDTNGQEALTIGASVTLNLYPEGASSGDNYVTGTGLVQGVGVAVTKGGITERRISVIGTGALSHTTV